MEKIRVIWRLAHNDIRFRLEMFILKDDWPITMTCTKTVHVMAVTLSADKRGV